MISNIGIQNCFGCHVSMYRYERSTKTMQVISTWHLLKNKDMGYSQQLILSYIWPCLKRVAWNSKFIWKIVILTSTSKLWGMLLKEWHKQYSRDHGIKMWKYCKLSQWLADYMMHNKIRRTKCDIHSTPMVETFINKHTHL